MINQTQKVTDKLDERCGIKHANQSWGKWIICIHEDKEDWGKMDHKFIPCVIIELTKQGNSRVAFEADIQECMLEKCCKQYLSWVDKSRQRKFHTANNAWCTNELIQLTYRLICKTIWIVNVNVKHKSDVTSNDCSSS
jgi:hypothetical protein